MEEGQSGSVPWLELSGSRHKVVALSMRKVTRGERPFALQERWKVTKMPKSEGNNSKDSKDHVLISINYKRFVLNFRLR